MMSVDLLTLQRKQQISIPGEHRHFEIICKVFVPLELSHIHVAIHMQKYKHGFRYREMKFCYSLNYMHCLQIWKNNIEYIIYKNLSNYYPNTSIDQKMHFSWLHANRFCKRMGYELPHFMNRDELDDLIGALHGIFIIPYLEAIFIGLFKNEHKVIIYILHVIYFEEVSTFQ